MKYVGAALSLLVAGFTFTAKANSPVVEIVVGNTKYQAETECHDDRHFTIHISEFLSPEKKKYTIIHEMTHVKQIWTLSCEVGNKAYTTSSSFRFDAELQAYCNEVKAKVSDGLELANPIDVNPANGEKMKFYFFMFFTYGRNLGLDSTQVLINNECPELAGL